MGEVHVWQKGSGLTLEECRSIDGPRCRAVQSTIEVWSFQNWARQSGKALHAHPPGEFEKVLGGCKLDNATNWTDHAVQISRKGGLGLRSKRKYARSHHHVASGQNVGIHVFSDCSVLVEKQGIYLWGKAQQCLACTAMTDMERPC